MDIWCCTITINPFAITTMCRNPGMQLLPTSLPSVATMSHLKQWESHHQRGQNCHEKILPYFDLCLTLRAIFWKCQRYHWIRRSNENQEFHFQDCLSLNIMCYLDIHPANILLTLFMLHPLPTKNFNSAFPSFSLEKLCLLVVSEPWVNWFVG